MLAQYLKSPSALGLFGETAGSAVLAPQIKRRRQRSISGYHEEIPETSSEVHWGHWEHQILWRIRPYVLCERHWSNNCSGNTPHYYKPAVTS